MGATLLIFASKTSIVSINYAKANSSNLLGLEQSFCFSAHKHNQEKGLDSQGRERDFFSFPSRAMRASPHCTEKCVRQLAHICSTVRGSVRAATAGTVAPSHLLLKFGKLTIEFEMPFQFRKVKPHRCGTVAPSHLLLTFGKLTIWFELLCQFRKAESRRPSRLLTEKQSLHVFLSQVRQADHKA